MWVRNGNLAGVKLIWNTAMSWVKSLNYGGYSDWRLPTKEELESFADRGGRHPSEWLNSNGFQKVSKGYYWTSSIYDTVYPWNVYMETGAVGHEYDKSYDFYVWPVRSGR